MEYDALGLPKHDGFDYYKYITTDTGTLDTVIDATPDQMEKAYRPKGERFDIDKEHDKMNEEGKSHYFITIASLLTWGSFNLL